MVIGSIGSVFFLKKRNIVKKYIRIVAGQYRRTPIEVIEAEGVPYRSALQLADLGLGDG